MSEASSSFHYLVIDDSELIRQHVARGIVQACTQAGYTYRLFQVNRAGKVIEQTPSTIQPTSDRTYYIYTAANYKLSLSVLNIPTLDKVTALCDLSIPGDVEVGLFGFLEALVSKKVPTNLIFISNDYGNRAGVEMLLKKGKAYFVEKGTPVWDTLAEALVQRATQFDYQKLAISDYSTRTGANTVPAFIEQLAQATAQAANKATTVMKTDEPLAIKTEVEKKKDEPKPEPRKPGRVGSLVNSVRDLPGKAGSFTSSGAARIAAMPMDLFKRVPSSLPKRSPKKDTASEAEA